MRTRAIARLAITLALGQQPASMHAITRQECVANCRMTYLVNLQNCALLYPRGSQAQNACMFAAVLEQGTCTAGCNRYQ